jgi:hypothetical protein
MAMELLREARARGYQVGAHKEKDIIKEVPKYVRKTHRGRGGVQGQVISFT